MLFLHLSCLEQATVIITHNSIPWTVNSDWPTRLEERNIYFFCFEAGIQGGVQCQGTHLATNNPDTDTNAQNCTTSDYTPHVNMPQDGCTSTPKVAGLMSPANPYRNTWQDNHVQGKTTQQDKLKDARGALSSYTYLRAKYISRILNLFLHFTFLIRASNVAKTWCLTLQVVQVYADFVASENQPLEIGQCKTTADCGLQTADCGQGVKCRLSVKCRLQT